MNLKDGASTGICTALRADGRSDAMYAILESGVQNTKHCPECIAFFKSLQSHCKPRKPKTIRLKKGEEAKETPTIVTPKYMEPSTGLIVLLLDTFQKYKGGPPRDLKTKIGVVRSFLELIEDPENMSRGEWLYLQIFAAYVRAPFEEEIQAEIRQGIAAPSYSVDSLFDQ